MGSRLGVVALLAIIVASFAAEPSWHMARAPGQGCWPPRCTDEQVPLATPVVVHAGRLIMLGDGAAPRNGYESTDGIGWRAFEHDAAWGNRYRSADISFGGALWRIGGFVQDGATRTAMNDIWRSADGRRWERVLARAPWAPRADAHVVVLRDSLWLIGGVPHDERFWVTTDGRNWSARATTGLPAVNPQGVLVHRGAMWILGHGAWETATNDVWTSRDGASWTRVTGSARWPARTAAGFAVFGDRMWVVAGATRRDAWSSANGRDWQRIAEELPGPPRGADYSVVFANALWVFGGKTGGAGGTGFWDGVAFLK